MDSEHNMEWEPEEELEVTPSKKRGLKRNANFGNICAKRPFLRSQTKTLPRTSMNTEEEELEESYLVSVVNRRCRNYTSPRYSLKDPYSDFDPIGRRIIVNNLVDLAKETEKVARFHVDKGRSYDAVRKDTPSIMNPSNNIYDVVFKMCTNSPPRDHSQQCYDLMIPAVDLCLNEQIQSCIADLDLELEKKFASLCVLFCTATSVLRSLNIGYSYMDRFFTKTREIPLTKTVLTSYVGKRINEVLFHAKSPFAQPISTINDIDQLDGMFRVLTDKRYEYFPDSMCIIPREYVDTKTREYSARAMNICLEKIFSEDIQQLIISIENDISIPKKRSLRHRRKPSQPTTAPYPHPAPYRVNVSNFRTLV